MRGQRGIFCHCEELIKFYAIVSPRNNRNKKTTNTIEGGDLLRKFFLMVVALGLGIIAQETAAQGLRPLKPLSSGLRPLRPLVARQDMAKQHWLAKLEEERARNLKIAQIRTINLATRASEDSIQLAEYNSRQMEVGVRMPTYYPPATFPASGDEISLFLWALVYKVPESGGNYYAENKKTGAYGKYQFISSTWQLWATRYAQATGAPPASVIEPIPFNQERVARFMAETLFGQYGNWRDVASVWFSGEPYYSYKNPAAISDGRTNLKDYCDTILQVMNGN
ncbi:hypothetical protein A3H03_01460 [Candidatus Kuenenbacteria bacterium RIFCSPLOWO2_12_FULL_42_13]|uniref:Uncharacterized protein n=1 Tax=Candidatus Kuenenbacteria bacterium RIFCSPLOWO2_12_FULL_42_13 TaxID=1798565 RepID=A0A1F6G310_9BACT|nr:MAG: hypothetical protein A3H03_01460 [Candidatus Kuenenbacteria bacterium RIFCSPLOWO2_12_FULL_42_13]